MCAYKPYQPPEPHNLAPNDSDIPLVAVIRHREFSYYVLPDYLCFLDCTLIFQILEGEDHPEENDPRFSDRFGVCSINDANADRYFAGIEPYKRSCEDLRDMMKMCMNYWEVIGFEPTLIYDFDKKHAVSYFPGYTSYEIYIPPDWTSEYRPIREDEIPPDKRFWIDTDGTNLLHQFDEDPPKTGAE